MVTLTKQFDRFGRAAMNQGCLRSGSRPAPPALLSANSRRENFFLDACMWQFAGHLSRCRLLGSDGASLKRTVDAFVDPIAADVNLYRYCGDSPTNFMDPSGCLQDEAAVTDGTLKWSLSPRPIAPPAAGDSEIVKEVIAAQQAIGPFSVAFHMEYVPSPKNHCRHIGFVQVVVKTTFGGQFSIDLNGEMKSVYKDVMADPLGGFVDIGWVNARNWRGMGYGEPGLAATPYYGYLWDIKKKELVRDPDIAGKQQIGHGYPNPLNAIMEDEPSGEMGRGKVFISQFETYAFDIDGQKILGGLKWGFQIPANPGAPITLLQATKANVSREASPAVKAAVAKYNSVLKGHEGVQFITGPSALP